MKCPGAGCSGGGDEDAKFWAKAAAEALHKAARGQAKSTGTEPYLTRTPQAVLAEGVLPNFSVCRVRPAGDDPGGCSTLA